jgi:phospholipase C
VFRPYNGEKLEAPAAVNKEAFIESVHKAKFKEVPANYKLLSPQEIAGPLAAIMPQQEPGIRPSCAIPYQLYADAKLSADRKKVVLRFKAGNTLFGKRAAGAPFTVYGEKMEIRSYAVSPGDALTDEWDAQQYALNVYGPNGFYQQMNGNTNDPLLEVMADYAGKKAELVLNFNNHGKVAYTVEIQDVSYKGKPRQVKVEAGKKVTLPVALDSSFGWYDLAIKVQGAKDFVRRYAGHVETGTPGFSDPLMGRTV